MADDRALAMIRELEDRYGYVVTKRPCTPEEWRAEAVRVLDLLEVPGRRVAPVVTRELEAVARSLQDS